MLRGMSEIPQTPYRVLGDEGVRALVDEFYDLMDSLPEARAIRAMHEDDLTDIRERLYVFIRGWMGGPAEYASRYGSANIPSLHAPFDIGADDREAWLLCMERALDNSALHTHPLRERVSTLFRRMAEMCETLDESGKLKPHFASIRAEMAAG